MKVLRVLSKISNDKVRQLPRGKYILDKDTDFFYFIDFCAFTFRLGDRISAAYTPDGKLFSTVNARLTYVTLGWGDQQEQTVVGSYQGCGFQFSEDSHEAINDCLETVSNFSDSDINRYLYFIDYQEKLPLSIPIPPYE